MQACYALTQADDDGNLGNDDICALACDTHGSAATKGQEAREDVVTEQTANLTSEEAASLSGT